MALHHDAKKYINFSIIAFTICNMPSHVFGASYAIQNTTKNDVRVFFSFDYPRDDPFPKDGYSDGSQTPIIPAGETLVAVIGWNNTIEYKINGVQVGEEKKKIRIPIILDVEVFWKTSIPNLRTESSTVDADAIMYGPIKKGQNWNFQIIQVEKRTRGTPYYSRGTWNYHINKQTRERPPLEGTIYQIETWKNDDGSYWNPDKK